MSEVSKHKTLSGKTSALNSLFKIWWPNLLECKFKYSLLSQNRGTHRENTNVTIFPIYAYPTAPSQMTEKIWDGRETAKSPDRLELFYGHMKPRLKVFFHRTGVFYSSLLIKIMHYFSCAPRSPLASRSTTKCTSTIVVLRDENIS